MKKLNKAALFLSLVMTLGLEVLMQQKEVPLVDRIVGGILFLLINYLLLRLMIPAIQKLLGILALPGKKLNSYAYWLYPIAFLVLYLGFLFIALRLSQIFLPGLAIFGVIAAGVLLLLLAQAGGAFPVSRLTGRQKLYKLDRVGGALGGFDFLGSLAGTYQDGIILGTETIPYASLDYLRRKADALLVEGKGDPRVQISVLSPKAMDFLAQALQEHGVQGAPTLAKDLAELKNRQVKEAAKEEKSADLKIKGGKHRLKLKK